MKSVSFPRILLYGFLTYSAIFMLWSLLAAYNYAYGWVAQGGSYLLTVVVVAAAARAVGVTSLETALWYSIGWTLIHIILDLIYVVPAAGFAAIFTKFGLISYGIVFLTPFFASMYNAHTQKAAAVVQSNAVL